MSILAYVAFKRDGLFVDGNRVTLDLKALVSTLGAVRMREDPKLRAETLSLFRRE